MKSFIFDRNAQNELTETETNKVPVYNSLQDATSDLTNLEVGQVIATKDDKLLIGSTKDVYSTEVTNTGKLWINNKPIYRLVIKGQLNSNGEGYLGNVHSTYDVEKITYSDMAWQSEPDGTGTNEGKYTGTWAYRHNSDDKPGRIASYLGNTVGTYTYIDLLSFVNPQAQNCYFTAVLEFTKCSDSPVTQAGWAPAEIAKWVEDGETYSTNEVLTHKKWIDGRPIYRKVFELTLSSDNQHSTILPTGATAINCTAIGTRNDNRKITFPVIIPSNYNYMASFYIGEDEYYFRAGSSFINEYCPMPAKLIVEYIKATN